MSIYGCQKLKLCWCTFWRNRTFLLRLFVANCVVLSVLVYALNQHRLGSLLWSTESYFRPTLGAADRTLIDRTFRVFVDALASANLTFFIFSGTLLGSYRHLDMIPWDDDIDVIVNGTDRRTVDSVLSRLEPNYFLSTNGGDTESGDGYVYQWKFYPKEGRRPWGWFGFPWKKTLVPYVDVFFFLENETHIWNASPYFPDEIWIKSDVFPLQLRPFGDLLLRAPCNVEAMLGRAALVDESTGDYVCVSPSYNHLTERQSLVRPISVSCGDLAHLYPFVVRRRRSSSRDRSANPFDVVETLMWRNRTLKRIVTRMPCSIRGVVAEW